MVKLGHYAMLHSAESKFATLYGKIFCEFETRFENILKGQ
jgi:hypothetical protein